jgi:hypothetical protein
MLIESDDSPDIEKSEMNLKRISAINTSNSIDFNLTAKINNMKYCSPIDPYFSDKKGK